MCKYKGWKKKEKAREMCNQREEMVKDGGGVKAGKESKEGK